MLYRPDSGSCHRSELAIVDETNGHLGHSHMSLRQQQIACLKSLPEFLLGFGILIPSRNPNRSMQCADGGGTDKGTSTVVGASFNAHLLSTISRIKIRWMDCLACHLEFDDSTSTLYLFRYPSFCIANLPLEAGERNSLTTLHACGAAVATPHCGTPEDIDQLLCEILMTYRLLFKDKASRKLFRSMRPFGKTPSSGHDHILASLCGRKHPMISLELMTREVYDLRVDFPILGNRLLPLMQHLSQRRPRTWRELWNDKRDSASWFTFWAVLIIGGVGLMLAFVQVVLQAVELALELHQ